MAQAQRKKIVIVKHPDLAKNYDLWFAQMATQSILDEADPVWNLKSRPLEISRLPCNNLKDAPPGVQAYLEQPPKTAVA